MNTSDVTIIIPIYVTNKLALQWLDECLASAVIQGCNVSVYDDGSALLPETRSLVAKYGIKYTGWSLTNRGVSYARNAAIANAPGPLILPLDCDDRLKLGAVAKLLEFWHDDVPVYPDIEKVGLEKDPHYILLDFNEANILKYVGFSSVNVLYSKAQWAQIGGYNEELDFYEDGEFAGRLFQCFCGVRCPFPLVEYRFHENQRTKTYAKRSAEYAKKVYSSIRRSGTMACPGGCGGKRRTVSSVNKGVAPTRASTSVLFAPVDASAMPPVDSGGRVLAHYVGGSGRGTHYYQGLISKYQYKVLFGQYLYADERDTKASDDTSSHSLLVKAGAPSKPATKVVINTAQPPAVVQKAPPTRTPVRTVQDMASSKAPSVSEMPIETNKVLDVAHEPETQNLPDIRNMTYRQVVSATITPQEAKELLKAETGADGLNRSGVKQHLKKLVEMDD